MAIVYIFGAGASYGDTISPATVGEVVAAPGARLVPPPLVSGFFNEELYRRLGYAGTIAAADFREAFDYVRLLKHIPTEAVGMGAWNRLDLEEIFTAVELEREFWPDQSDQHSKLTVVRNKLVRYIGRIIALCTQGGYGAHTREFAASLDAADSVLTFNWDLLLDHELHPRESDKWQYKNFFTLMLQDFQYGAVIPGPYGEQGMLLKLHGSFNWYQCTNRLCRQFTTVTFFDSVQLTLQRAMGVGQTICQLCGSEMNPLLIPPLLRKPINDNPTIRSIWGVAKRRLESASTVVVIGFSLPPTDFYASWLLRSAQSPDTKVFVVNPMNDPAADGHEQFKRRMNGVFPLGYNSEFRSFAQITEILARVRG